MVDKSSLSLDGIARSFAKTIDSFGPSLGNDAADSEEKEEDNAVEEKILALTDVQHRMAATMIDSLIHQSE